MTSQEMEKSKEKVNESNTETLVNSIYDVNLKYTGRDEPIPSNKHLLSTYSNHFKKIINDTKPNVKTIMLSYSNNIPASTFIMLHDYIFDRSLKLERMSIQEKIDLFRLSKYYEFDNVNRFLVKYFILDLSIKNCWQILSLSFEYKENKLMHESVKLITNLPNYEKHEEYQKLIEKDLTDFNNLIAYYKNISTTYENTNYFSKKLNDYFENNIKLSFISDLKIIIITKEDNVYEFDRNILKNLQIIFNNEKSIIEQNINKSFVEKLCNKGIVEIKCVRSQSIGLTFEGKIYSWGSNEYGLLGNGINEKNTNHYEPELNKYLINKQIIQISLGAHHALVLTKNGDVYSWGGNYCGQIGNGMIGRDKYQTKPYLITTFNNEKMNSISCGSDHSLSLSDSGHVYSWGSNRFGQLGNTSDEIYSISPNLIKFDDSVIVMKINCGHSHSSLLTSEGEIYVFGSNRSGELGINTEHEIQTLPIKLHHSLKFKQVSSYYGKHFTSALLLNDLYYIWGNCGNEIIFEPKETPYTSFNEIFINHFGINLTPVEEKIMNFKDDLFRRNFFAKKFNVIRNLGEGSFGSIREVMINNCLNVNNRYAVKTIAAQHISIIKVFENNSLIKDLSHKNIVKYYDLWIQNFNSTLELKQNEKLLVYIQMELCDFTICNLMRDIRNVSSLVYNNNLTLLGYYISCQLFIQILEGVNYLHTRNPQIIHRNLNTNNILLKISEDKGNIVKIADFDLLCLHKYEGQHHSQDIGDLNYAAPEVQNSNIYDTRADIYSLGVVLSELFLIDMNSDYEETKETSILTKKYKELRIVFKKMTKKDVNERPKSCQQILENKELWTLNKKEIHDYNLFKYMKCDDKSGLISRLVDKFYSFFKDEQHYKHMNLTEMMSELRANRFFLKYSNEFKEIENLSNYEIIRYIHNNIVKKENKLEYRHYIRTLLNNEKLINSDIIVEIIIKNKEKSEKNKIKNFIKEEKIKLILDVIERDDKEFLNILLLTGQDDAALLLDPNNIDLTDLSRCDPSKGHIDYFSFGEENPKDEFYYKEGKLRRARSNEYLMKNNPKGFCYLINNCFTIGTYKEMQRFRNIFHKLQFKVIMRKNISAKEIYSDLIYISKNEDLEKQNAFVFMIISHGNEKEIYGFDGKALKIDSLINIFNIDNCSHLNRKPKIFFINLVERSKRDPGVDVSLDASEDANADGELFISQQSISDKVPKVDDVFIIYSTLYGYKAQVKWNEGTIFGKVLADSIIEGVIYKDINGLLNLANGKLEKDYPDIRQRIESFHRGKRDMFFINE